MENVDSMFKSKYAKLSNEHRKGVRATSWSIYDIHNFRHKVVDVKFLPDIYKDSMDLATYSFDLVVEKIRILYTPEQNEHI